ncbi:MAG: hypothetical protein SVV80_09940 [Planctomycetota bacterium]|nr:hypothetical protein [Planctomycetota bacterium]
MKHAILVLVAMVFVPVWGSTSWAAITITPTRMGYVSWQFNNSSIWHAAGTGSALIEWPDSSYPIYYHTRYNNYPEYCMSFDELL